MGTDASSTAAELERDLRESAWNELTKVIQHAADWLEQAPMGTAQSQMVVDAMTALADHEKWEVRRALALAAGACRSAAFDEVLSRLAADANARVQQAAEVSSLRRRDWRAAGLLGREHEERLDQVLEDIQHRFGAQGRAAVRRAANEMVSTFARELYHEVIRHITPLDREVQRLKRNLATADAQAAIVGHAVQIEADLTQLKIVLKAMREYAATPELMFASERLRDVVDHAVRTTDAVAESLGVAIENRVNADVVADIARGRFLQALSNVLCNAVEAYAGLSDRRPILVESSESVSAVTLSIRDHGAGMSTEVLVDARALFSSHKINGTGVGLPLAIKIIESEHDGRVTIDSAVDEGTTIRVTVPRFRRA
jgi:signal transduction histidine kinase